MTDNLLIAITSWLGIIAVTICIIQGHDGVLVDVLAGVNLAGIGGTVANSYRKSRKKGGTIGNKSSDNKTTTI